MVLTWAIDSVPGWFYSLATIYPSGDGTDRRGSGLGPRWRLSKFWMLTRSVILSREWHALEGYSETDFA